MRRSQIVAEAELLSLTYNPYRMKFCLAALLFSGSMAAAQGQQPLWKPAADTIYLQEIGTKIVTDDPITALAVHDSSLYAVMEGWLARLADGRLTPVDGGES